MIRILIVDDQVMLHESISAYFNRMEDFHVVGCAADGREAVNLVEKLLSTPDKPDLILMDIQMKNMRGDLATEQILQLDPTAKIVAITAFENQHWLDPMLRAGVDGYVIKSGGLDLLLDTIKHAVRGEPFNNPLAFVDPKRQRRGKEAQSEYDRLSKREKEVLQLIAEDNTNQEIAGKLEIATKTVETYRNRLMEKLDIHSSVGLTRFYMRNRN